MDIEIVTKHKSDGSYMSEAYTILEHKLPSKHIAI